MALIGATKTAQPTPFTARTKAVEPFTTKPLTYKEMASTLNGRNYISIIIPKMTAVSTAVIPTISFRQTFKRTAAEMEIAKLLFGRLYVLFFK